MQLSDIDFSEHLAKYRDHEVVIIIASVGKAEEEWKEQIVCGICGFPQDGAGECPRCRLEIEEKAKELRARREREAFFREIEEIARKAWEDFDQEDPDIQSADMG